MNVSDVMTSRESLVTATLPGTREDVLDRLRTNEFSSVPVVNGETGVYRGLISRERLIEEPTEDQLALLAEDAPTTTPKTTLAGLAELIRATGERRVPVVTGEEPALAGIVTVTDLIRALARGDVGDGDRPVSELATERVNCVHGATPLPAAERELSYAGEAYGVVLDDEGEVVGMVTDVDVLEAAHVVEGETSTGDSLADEDDDWKWEGIKAVGARYLPTRNVELPGEPVTSFMTEELVTVTGSRPAREAARLLVTNDVEQLPAMSGNRLIGVLRDVDLLGAVDE